jgi:hypothetical protein
LRSIFYSVILDKFQIITDAQLEKVKAKWKEDNVAAAKIERQVGWIQAMIDVTNAEDLVE